MMYTFNFPQQSNVENFFDDYYLVADDDGTAIQDNQCIVRVEIWARSARGAGDQSQFYGNLASSFGFGSTSIPSFSATTRDGTGMLTLIDGVLEINIPSSIMQRMIPGYYELGMTISDPDSIIISQLLVGTLPIYNGGVWTV